MSVYLSPTMNRLADVIGLPMAQKLCDTFGGAELYIPHDIKAGHPIAQCIGLDAAQKLARVMGRERPDIPKADEISRHERNRAIVAAVKSGASKKNVGRKHGLTTRWIRRICNGAGGDDRQMGLFDPVDPDDD